MCFRENERPVPIQGSAAYFVRTSRFTGPPPLGEKGSYDFTAVSMSVCFFFSIIMMVARNKATKITCNTLGKNHNVKS